jgi:hypothetical protein
MGTQPSLPVKSGLNTGRLAGATSNTEILGTQQVRRDKLVHYDATDAATKHMTKDAHLEFVRKTGNSKNKKQQKQEAAKTRSSMQLDVSISILRQTAVNSPYNVQWVSVENYLTKLALPVTGNLHGRLRHFLAQSTKSNIMMLSALRFLPMNYLISIPLSGRNRL